MTKITDLAEAKDIAGDMEMPLLVIRDLVLAIGYICDGTRDERAIAIHTIANQSMEMAEKLLEQRHQVWSALCSATRRG